MGLFTADWWSPHSKSCSGKLFLLKFQLRSWFVRSLKVFENTVEPSMVKYLNMWEKHWIRWTVETLYWQWDQSSKPEVVTLDKGLTNFMNHKSDPDSLTITVSSYNNLQENPFQIHDHSHLLWKNGVFQLKTQGIDKTCLSILDIVVILDYIDWLYHVIEFLRLFLYIFICFTRYIILCSTVVRNFISNCILPYYIT